MAKQICLSVMIISLITVPLFSSPQSYQPEISSKHIKLGIEAEFFDRLIKWDENLDQTSSLKSYLFLLKPGYEIIEGTFVSAVLGYSLSNFDQMIFRELPFSLELNTGYIDGIALGGNVLARIIDYSDFTLTVRGQFIYYMGFKDQWEIPGLNVEGTATGTPSWARLAAGPKVSFHVSEYLRPYVSAQYDRLWGTFNMEEEIEELSGEQDMKIESKSCINFSVGVLYEIIDQLDLKAEASVLPLESSIGLSIMAGAIYSF